MTTEELNRLSRLLTRLDKEKVAIVNDVTVAYINLMLAEQRERKSTKARRIIRDLEILANINELAEMEKETVLKAA